MSRRDLVIFENNLAIFDNPTN